MRKVPSVRGVAFAIALSCFCAQIASADIVYDNIGVEPGGDTALTITSPPPNSFSPLANSFSTPNALTSLSQVDLLLSALFPNDGGSLSVYLLNNGSGNTPGTNNALIGTIDDSTLPLFSTDPVTRTVVPLSVLPGVTLAANSRYWIELVQSPSAGSSAQWAWSNIDDNPAHPDPRVFGVFNEYWCNGDGGTSFTSCNQNNGLFQMRVEVTSVAAAPGPVVGAGLPGLLAGFGAILVWYRKRRAAVI